MSQTAIRVNTYTHTVAYLSDKILDSLKVVIYRAGLDLESFMGSWASTDRAIRAWLNSRHLEKVVLEIYNPSTGKLVTRWDLNIQFTDSYSDDGEFWADSDAIKFAIKKCGEIPSNCKYDLKILNKDGSPDVDGWSPCKFRSTEGLTKRSAGTTIDAGIAGASANYWS